MFSQEITRITFILFLSIFLITGGAYASENEIGTAPNTWYAAGKLGFSAFTGIIGFELQRHHFALDIGLPFAGAVRYYARPDGHSWFGGLYGLGYGFDNTETKDGITYTHYSHIEGGLGGGYRWLWRTRW